MDILADKYKLDGNRPGPFLAVLRTLLGIVRWPIRFFTLTEADRLKAGISVGGEGHDE
jgi:hypothetical protein